jgi:hypothetical protein
MATQSFDEMMIIDADEKATALNAAFLAAEERGPLKFDGPDIDEMLIRGEEFLNNNPNWLKEVAAKARERIITRGEDPDLLIKNLIWPDD